MDICILFDQYWYLRYMYNMSFWSSLSSTAKSLTLNGAIKVHNALDVKPVEMTLKLTDGSEISSFFSSSCSRKSLDF